MESLDDAIDRISRIVALELDLIVVNRKLEMASPVWCAIHPEYAASLRRERERILADLADATADRPGS